MKITKTQLKQIIKEELTNIAEGGPAGHYEKENFRTVDYMIDFYNEKPNMWEFAEYHYHKMAQGEDPEGVRSEMYPHWSDEDFAQVIEAVGSQPSVYYEGKDKSFSEAGEEIEKKGTEGAFTAKAKKAGMGVQAYAKKVLAKDSKASTKTKRQAAFAKGAATVARKNKK